MKNAFKLIVAIVVCELAGAIGALFTGSVSSPQGWYSTLVKPALMPPGWVFGAVWMTLYALMGIALFLVWKNDWKVARHLFAQKHKAWNKLSQRLWTGDLQKANIIALFWVQLAFNVLWSVLFFGLHEPGIAFFGIMALWFSILYVIVNFWRVSKGAAWLLIPYIAWVSFAAYLNFAIWLLNY